MRVAVYGLGHLGCVTAACLASAGHRTVGLDLDEGVVEGLKGGGPASKEPGLPELIATGVAGGRLSFTVRPSEALAGVEVLWVTIDTPVDGDGRADVASVRSRLGEIAPAIGPGTLVLISSQVPVGFTRALEEDWRARGLRFACAPENLRIGRALEGFRQPERVVVGIRDESDRGTLAPLLEPFCERIEWMSVESAEMTKHALNAYLAASVAFINEVARLCEAVGADAKEVERGLRSEGRVGPRAYVTPGAAFAGVTLARDLRYLAGCGERHSVDTPLVAGALASNEAHKSWIRDKVRAILGDIDAPVAAVLGLAYKAGTGILRGSTSLELCAWLHGQGVKVQAHDPAVEELPGELASAVGLFRSPREALAGADVAVVATECPEFRALTAADFLESMRRPRVVDLNWLLAASLAEDRRVVYVAPGRGPRG